MICFHCGQPGHRTSTCPSSGLPQSLAGREAFQRFIDRRSKHNSIHGRKVKGPFHDFERVAKWMSDAMVDHRDEDDTRENLLVKDPFAILQAEEEYARTAEDDAISLQRKERHKQRRNNLDRAFRESFNQRIDVIREDLMSRLDVTQETLAASTWQSELNRAVVLGKPANFASQDNDDDPLRGGVDDDDSGRCIKVYAVEKLKTRSRYLHHLLFGDNHYASKVRSLLLPLPEWESLNGSTFNNDNDTAGVNIISLGGGPGFDHVAMCLASQFLYDIQPNNTLLKPRHINMRIFDLFDKDWAPIMSMLSESCFEGLNHPLYNNGHDGLADVSFCTNNNGRNMTMSHGDLRIGLNASIHADGLASAIQTADIICVQFVLHENASSILEQDDDTIVGAMRDILEMAPLGTIIICTDSANFLFPALKCTADKFGWIYLGDEEQREKDEKIAHLGPRSYVMLDRVEIKNDNLV